MSFSYCRQAKRSPTEFSQYSEDFYMSNDGYLKSKDIPKDDQAVIDSYFETRLEAILDMYSDTIDGIMGYNVEFSDEVVEIDNNKNKLDQILAVDQLIADYKASDPDNIDLSRDDLVAKMQKSYSDAVAAYQAKLKGETENVKEEETVKESE